MPLYPNEPNREMTARDLEEQDFLRWYAQQAQRTGINPDPNDPAHKYDYRSAYQAGAEPDETGHWPSKYKADDHPNRYVDGVDTKNGENAPTPSSPAQAGGGEIQIPEYNMGHAIADALFGRMGFGNPIRNVQKMAMDRAANQRADARVGQLIKKQEEAERQKKAIGHVMRGVVAVAKPTSPYYKDGGHLAEIINSSPDAQALFGGPQRATRLEEKDGAGDDIFLWETLDPKTQQPVSSVKGSTREIIDRFYAGAEPEQAMKSLAILKEQQDEQWRNEEKFKKLFYETPFNKAAAGMKLLPFENYMLARDLNSRLPEGQRLSDWQLKEMYNIPQEKNWKTIGGLIELDDGGMGYVEVNEQTRQNRTRRIEGARWKEHAAKDDKITEAWLDAAMPKLKDMPGYYEKARAMVRGTLLNEKDLNKREVLRSKVVPDFIDILERSGGVVADDDGKERELTSREMAQALQELTERYYTTKAVGGEQGKQPQYDNNQLSMYLPKTTPKPPKMGDSSIAAQQYNPDTLAGQAIGKATQPIAESVASAVRAGRTAANKLQQQRAQTAQEQDAAESEARERRDEARRWRQQQAREKMAARQREQ